ncbi:MAG: RNA polymerase sigma factor [Myxococcales bacterium]|nr:RNA polymerase sigma factor [Polyangiaceae bacterium]MDW8251060.1 RNA polymerase sigma factor [Myxococcales bacterium]
MAHAILFPYLHARVCKCRADEGSSQGDVYGEAGEVPQERAGDLRVASSRQGEVPDEMLMRRFQQGDASAFAPLMHRYVASVYHFIARHTSPGPSAEDLTQEVFLRVVERAGDFKHESRFSTWLFSITRNLCIDALRKQVHRHYTSLDEPDREGGLLGEQIPDEGLQASVERTVQRHEMAERLQEALRALPDEQREVFLLREIANLPFQEIAQVTGSPENTVKSRMRYALERLQEALRDLEEEARTLR